MTFLRRRSRDILSSYDTDFFFYNTLSFLLPMSGTHRALQYLGDPLPLLHHIEVLSQVRGHVSLPDILRVILIDAIEVPLFVRHRGWGRSSDHHLAGISTHASTLWREGFPWNKRKTGENVSSKEGSAHNFQVWTQVMSLHVSAGHLKRKENKWMIITIRKFRKDSRKKMFKNH